MDGGQVTVFGKGSKSRMVLLPNPIWREVLRFRQHADHDAPVFASRRGGGHLHPSTVERIVTKRPRAPASKDRSRRIGCGIHAL
jgi:integrase/recombinase XerD